MNKDYIQLPNTVIEDLKNQIKKHVDDKPDYKPKNFTEVAVIVGIGGFTRLNQLQKIVSWFDEKKSNDEDRKKTAMYGKLINFARQYLAQQTTNKKIANKTRRMTDHPTGTKVGSQTNSAGLQKRNVDRMNNVSSSGRASVTPANPQTNSYDMVTEQINRIKQLIKH